MTRRRSPEWTPNQVLAFHAKLARDQQMAVDDVRAVRIAVMVLMTQRLSIPWLNIRYQDGDERLLVDDFLATEASDAARRMAGVFHDAVQVFKRAHPAAPSPARGAPSGREMVESLPRRESALVKALMHGFGGRWAERHVLPGEAEEILESLSLTHDREIKLRSLFSRAFRNSAVSRPALAETQLHSRRLFRFDGDLSPTAKGVRNACQLAHQRGEITKEQAEERRAATKAAMQAVAGAQWESAPLDDFDLEGRLMHLRVQGVIRPQTLAAFRQAVEVYRATQIIQWNIRLSPPRSPALWDANHPFDPTPRGIVAFIKHRSAEGDESAKVRQWCSAVRWIVSSALDRDDWDEADLSNEDVLALPSKIESSPTKRAYAPHFRSAIRYYAAAFPDALPGVANSTERSLQR